MAAITHVGQRRLAKQIPDFDDLLAAFEDRLRQEQQLDFERAMAVFPLMLAGITNRDEVAAATGLDPTDVMRTQVRLDWMLDRLKQENAPEPTPLGAAAPPELDAWRAKWDVMRGPGGTDHLHVDHTTGCALGRAGLLRVADIEKASDARLRELRYIGPKRLQQIRNAVARYRAEHGPDPEPAAPAPRRPDGRPALKLVR